MHARRLLTLMFALLLAACASTGVPGATPAPTAPALEGTSWVVTQIKGAATLADKQPTIAFAEGRASGTATCNNFSAGFSQTDSKLSFSAVAMTAMACTDERLNTQEQAFAAALGEVTQVRSASTGAELLNTGGTAVLTLAAAPKVTPKPLVGTTWTLSGIVANEAVSSPVADTLVTLTFTDTALSGKACNTFRAGVTIKDATLAVGPVASTRMACPTDQEGAQEASVLATLEAATSYAIEGDTLTLTTPKSTGLVFTAS